jgi:hypothetical protein
MQASKQQASKAKQSKATSPTTRMNEGILFPNVGRGDEAIGRALVRWLSHAGMEVEVLAP